MKIDISDELRKSPKLNKMNEIIPSPGTGNNNWGDIEKKIELIKPFAKTIHIDVIDGIFASNTTFSDPSPFSKYTKDTIFEVHLMVDDPIKYLEPWADAGFQRFIGQIEKMPDPIEFVAQGQLLGAVGLAIDGPTSLESLKDLNLNDLDLLLIMTIKAGLSGQEFMPEHLEKVREIRKIYPYLPIEVDGGINETTILSARDAGANKFVTTSHLLKSENIRECFESLSSLIKE